MNVKIYPSKLGGDYLPPASKSFAHRLLIAAAISDLTTVVHIKGISDDVRHTAMGLRALGAGVTELENGYQITPIPEYPTVSEAVIDCGESGSTLRFLIPLACALGIKTTFVGKGRLAERPIGELLQALSGSHGVTFSSTALPLTINGKLTRGSYSIDGSKSSQCVSGMMLALAYLGKSMLTITGERVSHGYIKITERVLKVFNLDYQTYFSGYHFQSVSRLSSPLEITCPADASQAGFFAVAGAIGDVTKIGGIPEDTPQGDAEIFKIIADFGADVRRVGNDVWIRSKPLMAREISVKDIPDLAPILSVLAAFSEGDTLITHVERLRAKESDRLLAIEDMLTAFDVPWVQRNNLLYIYGCRPQGATIDGRNDHRIVMSACIMASFAEGVSIVTNAEAVNKSYPGFFEDFGKMGGKYDWI